MDVNVAYKLLKYVNNLYSFDADNKIKNIHSAVVYVGENNLRYFMNMIIDSNMVTKKPKELHRLAVQRSWFCYYLARTVSKLRQYEDSAAMLGLFSCLDALLDKSMAVVLSELPIDDEVKDALILGKGDMSDFIKFFYYYERGEWGELDPLLDKYKITEEILNKVYIKSIDVTDKKF